MFSPTTLIVGRPVYAQDRDCGYCHGSKARAFALQSYRDRSPADGPQSVVMGMSLENVGLQDYEQLCNRGFRRSGTFLYKPDLLRNCCRTYTIRTSFADFTPNKDQRKAKNRFFKALAWHPPVHHKGPTDMYAEFAEFESAVDKKKFRTQLEPAAFTKDKFELYKKYQVRVHNDDPEKVTKSSFKRFLCDNPFHESATAQGPMHELYYIDDKLAALAVLDILPDGISSVYFIWDPDHHKLGLGKISSLRELNLCKKLHKKWYYLGYYIPDCDKMRYKRNFGGELLDVTDNRYYGIEELEKRHMADTVDDLLFVVGARDQKAVEKPIETDQSPPIDFQNVAETIYGYGNDVYTQMDALKQAHFQHQPDEAGLLDFPSVVPGLVPMTQLVDIVDNQLAKGNIRITIYDPFDTLKPYIYGADAHHDKAVTDLIRLLGPALLQNSVVVVY